MLCCVWRRPEEASALLGEGAIRKYSAAFVGLCKRPRGVVPMDEPTFLTDVLGLFPDMVRPAPQSRSPPPLSFSGVFLSALVRAQAPGSRDCVRACCFLLALPSSPNFSAAASSARLTPTAAATWTWTNFWCVSCPAARGLGGPLTPAPCPVCVFVQCGVAVLLSGTLEQRLRFAFHVYERDREGFLRPGELATAFLHVHYANKRYTAAHAERAAVTMTKTMGCRRSDQVGLMNVRARVWAPLTCLLLCV